MLIQQVYCNKIYISLIYYLTCYFLKGYVERNTVLHKPQDFAIFNLQILIYPFKWCP
jgi:hypothetical protein